MLAIHAKFPENAVRLTLGRYNTEEEIDYACNRIIQIVKDINA
jgi:cysteine sulfinate desulfinase/cysteine desulfurase-like protein